MGIHNCFVNSIDGRKILFKVSGYKYKRPEHAILVLGHSLNAYFRRFYESILSETNAFKKEFVELHDVRTTNMRFNGNALLLFLVKQENRLMALRVSNFRDRDLG